MKKRIHGNPDWDDAIIIQVGKRQQVVIRNPADALIFLTNKWPCERGMSYKAATEVCSAALRRQVHSFAARESFLFAALEAKVLIPHHL